MYYTYIYIYIHTYIHYTSNNMYVSIYLYLSIYIYIYIVRDGQQLRDNCCHSDWEPTHTKMRAAKLSSTDPGAHHSEGVMIRLETLIELEFINSSCSSLSSC